MPDTSTAASRVPVPHSPLVGREAELRAVRTLLEWPDVPLVTIVGPGGVGKTRLALAMAREAVDAGGTRVFFVPLASLHDGELLASSVAQATGVSDRGQPPIEGIVSSLGGQRSLLVLDNLEHVLDEAAAFVADLVESCPGLKVLATSQSPLRLRGEREFPLAPLATPMRGATVANVETSDAVRLFAERARAIDPAFAVTNENAASIAGIVERLGGLPLAIELAAARTRLLAPQEMLPRLNNSLQLLAGGSRDLDDRHRTMRATLDWSYDLLSVAGRSLFAQLGVFEGSFGLDGIEAVCDAADGSNLLDLLGSLVEHHLVSRLSGGQRFGLLPVVGEYAKEKLRAAGNPETMQGRHLRYYLDLLEASVDGLKGRDQAEWLERLELEHENLAAAIRFAIDSGDAVSALRLGTAARWYWEIRAYFSEGRRHLSAALAVPGAVEATLRARALNAAGVLAWRQGDLVAARPLVEEALELRRLAGDQAGIAGSVRNLSVIAWIQGDYVRARALCEQDLELQREAGNTLEVAYALWNLGNIAMRLGEHKSARQVWMEALAIVRSQEDDSSVANILMNLSVVSLREGKLSEARRQAEESLAIARKLGERRLEATDLLNLASIDAAEGDLASGITLSKEALEIAQETGDDLSIATARGNIGLFASRLGRHEEAVEEFDAALAVVRKTGDLDAALHVMEDAAPSLVAVGRQLEAIERLAGAAAKRRASGNSDSVVSAESLEALASARRTVGEDAFREAWTRGWQSAGTQAPPEAPSPATVVARDALLDLTPRELDTVRLLAEGLTNADIATRLGLSAHTVNGHVRSIFSKLGVTTRAAATREALQRGLA